MATNELTLRHTSRLLIQIRPRPQVCDVTGTREILMAVQMEAVMKRRRCYIIGDMEGERCEEEKEEVGKEDEERVGRQGKETSKFRGKEERGMSK